MKEIIYLDTDMMNSMLAQLDEGIVNSFSLEQSNQRSETAGSISTRGKKATIKGSLNFGVASLVSTMGNEGGESANESQTILESQKDVLNKAFHDHALAVLENKLIEGDHIFHGENEMIKEGNIILDESGYRFYDFDLIKRSMDPNFLENIFLSEIKETGMSLEEAHKLVKKGKLTAHEREKLPLAQSIVDDYNQAKPLIDLFKQMNMFSNFATNLLSDLTLIKTNNKIGLLKRRYLRESTEALSFRTDATRHVKCLARVIGKKEIVYNGDNLPELQENDLDLVPNMMLDIILGSFSIINKGDFIVTPIAIYYE